MIEVVIPPDRLSDVQSEACALWLIGNVIGSAVGHVEGGKFMIRFDDAADADAFSAKWISPTGSPAEHM